jgi:hypothetical protein
MFAIPEFGKGGCNMQTTKALFTLENPAINEIQLSVGPVVYGRYGVFVDASLIAIHENRTSADAHCQRLIHKRADVPWTDGSSASSRVTNS